MRRLVVSIWLSLFVACFFFVAGVGPFRGAIGPRMPAGPGGPGIRSASVGPAAQDSTGVPYSGVPPDEEAFNLGHDGHISAARQYGNNLELTGEVGGGGQYMATPEEWAKHDLIEVDIYCLTDTTYGSNFVDTVRFWNEDAIIFGHEIPFCVPHDTTWQYTRYPWYKTIFDSLYAGHPNWVCLDSIGDTAYGQWLGGESYIMNILNDSCRTKYVQFIRDMWTDDTFCPSNLQKGVGIEFDLYNYHNVYSDLGVDLDQNGSGLRNDAAEQELLRTARIELISELRDTMALYQTGFLIGANGVAAPRDTALMELLDMQQYEGIHHWSDPFDEGSNTVCYVGAHPYFSMFDPDFVDSTDCQYGGHTFRLWNHVNQKQYVQGWLGHMRQTQYGPWVMMDVDSIPQKGEMMAFMHENRDGSNQRVASIYTRKWEYPSGYGDIADNLAWSRWWHYEQDGLVSLASLGAPIDTIVRHVSDDTVMMRLYENGSVEIEIYTNFDDTIGYFDYLVTSGTAERIVYRTDATYDTLLGHTVLRTNDSTAAVIATTLDTTGENTQECAASADEEVRWRFRSHTYGSAWGAWSDTSVIYRADTTVTFSDPRPAATKWYCEAWSVDQAGNTSTDLDSIGTGVGVTLKEPVLSELPNYNMGDTLTVSWNASAGADSYLVYADTLLNFSTADSSSAWGDSIYVLLSGLTEEKHYYKVRAKDATLGHSPWSSVDSTIQDATPPVPIWINTPDTSGQAADTMRVTLKTYFNEAEDVIFWVQHRDTLSNAWSDTTGKVYAATDTHDITYSTEINFPADSTYEGQQTWHWEKSQQGVPIGYVFEHRSNSGQWMVMDTLSAGIDDTLIAFSQQRGMVQGRARAYSAAETTGYSFSDSTYQIMADTMYFMYSSEDNVGNVYSDSTLDGVLGKGMVFTTTDLTAPDTASFTSIDFDTVTLGSTDNVAVVFHLGADEKALGQFWWKTNWESAWTSPDSLWYSGSSNDSVPSYPINVDIATDSSTAELSGDSTFFRFKLKDDEWTPNQSGFYSSRVDTYFAMKFERYSAPGDVTAPDTSHVHPVVFDTTNTDSVIVMWVSGSDTSIGIDEPGIGQFRFGNTWNTWADTFGWFTTISDSVANDTITYRIGTDSSTADLSGDSVWVSVRFKDAIPNVSNWFEARVNPDFVGVFTRAAGGANGYYTEYKIDADSVGSTLNRFPVTVVDSLDIYQTVANGGHVSNDGAVNIFFASTSTAGASDTLFFEVEYYDATTGKIVAHVRRDVNGSTDTSIFMHYGDSAPTTSRANTDSLWADYEFVCHMNGTSSLSDITGNTTYSSADGDMLTQDYHSWLGYRQDFDGDGDGVNWLASSPLALNATDYNITCWLEVDALNAVPDYWNWMLGARDDANDGWNISVTDANADADSQKVRISHRVGGSTLNAQTVQITLDQLYACGVRYDASENDLWIYLDGAQSGSNLNIGTPNNSTGDFTFGADPVLGPTVDEFNGFLDEVRVRLDLVSTDWVDFVDAHIRNASDVLVRQSEVAK